MLYVYLLGVDDDYYGLIFSDMEVGLVSYGYFDGKVELYFVLYMFVVDDGYVYIY